MFKYFEQNRIYFKKNNHQTVLYVVFFFIKRHSSKSKMVSKSYIKICRYLENCEKNNQRKHDMITRITYTQRHISFLSRFSINLMNEQDWEQDIAFHFNPRVDEETVVRNSHCGGWQEEERDIPFFPFRTGAKFTLRYLPFSYRIYLRKLANKCQLYKSFQDDYFCVI